MSRIESPSNYMMSVGIAQSQPQGNIEGFESYLESANLYLKTFEEIKIKNLNCYDKRCKEKVKFECKCLSQTTFICQTHVAAHLTDDISKTHIPTVLNPEICNKKWSKVINYLNDYNSQLTNLKKKMVCKITKHIEKIINDVDGLFTKIDAIISKNTEKIIYLTSPNLKILANMLQLQSNSIKNFTKKCDKVEISSECLDILWAEIRDWNATMVNQEITQIPAIAHASGSQLQNLSENQTIPILHWCEWESNEVHYFDWNENTHKSVTINGLDILGWSKSISIDYNNILLCGGFPDDNIPNSNENTSKMFKINLESQSFQTLASMNTGRAGHCFTYLNGFYYVLGGVDYQKHGIEKCERYSLENDRCEDIADLDHTRYDATCVSISKDNSIFIIGGRVNQNKLDKTIEKYDAAFNNWTLIQIQKPILSMGLGSCLLPDSNFIFIFGGFDINQKCQKECYLYYYKTNQVINSNPISSEYNSVVNNPVILKNKIYCYFVESDSERELSIYDIESGDWAIKT